MVLNNDTKSPDYQKKLDELIEKHTADLKKVIERLTMAVEASGAGVYDHAVPLDQNTYHSDRWAEILGYKIDELPSVEQFMEWLTQQIHPEDLPKIEKMYSNFIQNPKTKYDIEIRMKRKTGDWIWVHGLSKATKRDENGLATHIIGVMLDITDRKRAEERLRLDEDRLKALLKLSQLVVVSENELADYALEECVKLTQSEVGYLHFFHEDANTIQLFNWSKDTLQKCTAEKVAHYPLENAGIWADCVRNRKPVIHNDYPNLSEKMGYPEGHFPVLRHMSVPVFDGDKIVAVAGVGNKKNPYDESDTRQFTLFMNSLWRIIKQKRSEQALIHSNEELRNKSLEMEEFIYTISHDLKSPLVSILGFINLIHAEYKDTFPEDFNYYIERIEKNVEQMGKLITDILEYSKIGRISEEKEVYSLNEIINDVIGRFQPRLKQSSISINVEKRLPYIYIVKKRFTQVFENLIDNAIKYMGNEAKKKEINIGLKEKKGDYVTVFVQDTGIGIKKDYFPKLFQLFSRIPSPLNEEVSGSGIGLANVKKIIETHGGSIWLESEEGKGTIFYFDIPMPPT